jgi:hypothetical protein
MRFTVQAKWVPGCTGNIGNGVADHLPRPGSKTSLLEPELACSISGKIAK